MEMMGETSMDDTLFVTLGLRVHRKTGPWDYTVEVAFQTGDVKGDSLAAFAFAAVLGHTFADVKWKPRAAIEVAYASGDSNPADGDNDAFQTLFPTNHLHYGYADLVGWSNIINLRVRITARPTDTITVSAGEYDGIDYSYPFAQRLTDDLRAICNDKHLRVDPRIPMTKRGGASRADRRDAPA